MKPRFWNMAGPATRARFATWRAAWVWTISLWLGLFGTSQPTRGAEPAPWSLDEIRRRVAERTCLLKSFEIESEMETPFRPQRLPQTLVGRLRHLFYRPVCIRTGQRVTWDRGKWRLESRTLESFDEEFNESKSSDSFTLVHVGRFTINYAPNAPSPYCLASHERDDGPTYERDILISALTEDFLNRPNAEVLRVEPSDDGQPLVVVGCHWGRFPDSREEYSLDPARGFILVRSRIVSLSGVVRDAIRFEYRPDPTVGWVPTLAISERDTSERLSPSVARVVKLTINPDIPLDRFQIIAPPGTTVMVNSLSFGSPGVTLKKPTDVFRYALAYVTRMWLLGHTTLKSKL